MKCFSASSWRSSWNVNFLEADQEIILTVKISMPICELNI